MVNPTHLRYALVLEQHRHFLNAANALGISQPALSRAIQSLENALGVKIFDRETHGVWPTDRGVKILESARQLVLEFEDFQRGAELLRDMESHSIRISLGPFPALLLGHRAVADLLARVPDLHCRVRTDRWNQAADALLDREADLAIAELADAFVSDSRLRTEPVSSSRAVLFCRADHPLLAARIDSAEALRAYPWVCTRLPKRFAASLGTDGSRAGTTDLASGEFVPTVEVDLVDQIRTLVGRSDALGIGLLSMIEQELEQGLLRPLPFFPKWLRANYGFVWLGRRTLSPTTLKYMELVRQLEAELAEKEIALRQRWGCPVDP